MQPWKGNFKFRHKFWITKPFKGNGSAIGFHSGSPVSQSTDNPRETSSSNELMTFDTNSSKISKQTAQMKSDLNHKNHNYISVLSLVSVRPLSWIACHQIAAQIIGGLNANYNMFGSKYTITSVGSRLWSEGRKTQPVDGITVLVAISAMVLTYYHGLQGPTQPSIQRPVILLIVESAKLLTPLGNKQSFDSLIYDLIYCYNSLQSIACTNNWTHFHYFSDHFS